MGMRNMGIHINEDVLEQIPHSRATDSLLSMIGFGSMLVQGNQAFKYWTVTGSQRLCLIWCVQIYRRI